MKGIAKGLSELAALFLLVSLGPDWSFYLEYFQLVLRDWVNNC